MPPFIFRNAAFQKPGDVLRQSKLPIPAMPVFYAFALAGRSFTYAYIDGVSKFSSSNL